MSKLKLFVLFFIALHGSMFKMQAYNVGLCIAATGRYDVYAQKLIESARKYFCKNHTVTFFVFTDGYIEEAPDVVKIYQKRLGWPNDTLMRFDMFNRNQSCLAYMDYIFASDADMLFVDYVGDEILSDLVGTQHPGFVGKRGTYETNKKSTAYVKPKEGRTYFAGGFYGGSREEFFKLLHVVTKNIEIDKSRNYTAVWHDESHLNRYFIDHKPTLVLSPSYCYPESWKLSYTKKLLALDKNHDEMRKSDGIQREPLEEKHMVIIIPSYNNKKYYERNLKSVIEQQYSNYHIIYIDDCSQDGTADLVEAFIQNSSLKDTCTLIKNSERKGALENLYYAIVACDDHDIIVLLDGDDWLSDAQVLQKINATYTDKNVWLTHGKLREFPNNRATWCEPIPANVVRNNSFRKFKCASHLRTFYAWLFKKIKVEDLMFDGKFFEMTWDQAIMFPMLEMAGERHRFISDVVYIYNVENNINDNKVNAQLQRDLEQILRNKEVYKRLDS